MNWRKAGKGLFRAWVVSASVWVLYTAALAEIRGGIGAPSYAAAYLLDHPALDREAQQEYQSTLRDAQSEQLAWKQHPLTACPPTGANPDREAELQHLARITGMPLPTVRSDPQPAIAPDPTDAAAALAAQGCVPVGYRPALYTPSFQAPLAPDLAWVPKAVLPPIVLPMLLLALTALVFVVLCWVAKGFQ